MFNLYLNVYSATFERKIPYVSIKFIWPKLSFKTSVFLHIFCLDALSTDVKEIFNSPTTIVFCQFLSFCLLIFTVYIYVLLCRVHIHLQLLHLLFVSSFLSLWNALPHFLLQSVLKYFLSDISIDASDRFCSMCIEKSNGWDQFLELLLQGLKGCRASAGPLVCEAESSVSWIHSPGKLVLVLAYWWVESGPEGNWLWCCGGQGWCRPIDEQDQVPGWLVVGPR